MEEKHNWGKIFFLFLVSFPIFDFFKTAFLFPGVIFSIFIFLNFFIWGAKSSGAVPFTTLLALMALWFGVSVPLVFFGSYFAWKKPVETLFLFFNFLTCIEFLFK